MMTTLPPLNQVFPKPQGLQFSYGKPLIGQQSIRPKSVLDTVHFSGTTHVGKPTTSLSPRFTQAASLLIEFANQSQNKTPVIQGFKTAASVLDNGGSESEAIAAMLLPQAFTPGVANPIKPIRKLFQKEVAGLVEGIYDSVKLTDEKPFLRSDSTKANQAFLNRIPQLSLGARRILGAAILSQVELATHRPSEKLQPGDFAWLNSILQQLEKGGSNALCRELKRNIKRLRALNLLHQAAISPPQNKRAKPATPTSNVNYTPRLSEALDWALELHKTQIRKDTGAPYAIHLMDTAATVLEMSGSEEAAIAALLHDAPEEKPGVRNDAVVQKEIRKRFGDNVANMVQDCTLPFLDDWMKSRELYLAQIPKSRNPESHKIILADKLNNIKTLNRSLVEQGPKIWDLFYGKRDQQLWFYRSMQSLLKAKMGNTPFLQEYKAHIRELEQIAYSSPDAPKIEFTEKQRKLGLKAASVHARQLMEKNPAYLELNQIVRATPSTFPKTKIRQGDQEVPAFPPERLKRHEEIMAKEYGQYLAMQTTPPTGPPKAHIVTGPLGAGKSCYVSNPLMKRDKALSLDADTIKQYFPETYHIDPNLPQYRHLNLPPSNGLGASAIHGESSYLTNKLLEKAIDNRNNFVISYTGRDLGWDQKMIRDLKAKGYQVFVHHVQVSLTTSVNRMFHRYNTQGRYTPPDILINTSSNSTDNFTKLRDWGLETGLVDGYSWHYNDVKEGTPPILLESYNIAQSEYQLDEADKNSVLVR